MASALCLSSCTPAAPAFSGATALRRAAARAPLAVRANASVKPPQGVTLPPKKPQKLPPAFGFVYNAERLNSRAAMIGFFALLAVELVAGQGLLDMLGFTTGKGLGFEF
ncbi:high-light-induced chloroplastic [Micractinium conductrix]|uniref:High-light-induced chloroplastic n=1 Tax=Micractinium conductrix TaxID=554055 RepID=A0A2P6VKT3_9CHLO|nr:high-light-induced chloroplastic [Micractinium conductrix]|eukprot:PSC74670.1 high-light-induced chloroplastic [Micractinium conductrix]